MTAKVTADCAAATGEVADSACFDESEAVYLHSTCLSAFGDVLDIKQDKIATLHHSMMAVQSACSALTTSVRVHSLSC
jgi:hypothetical protein